MLKPFGIWRDGTVVRLEREPGRAFEFDDESGVIEAALRSLDGSRGSRQVAAELSAGWPAITDRDVDDLVAVLDAEGLVEDAAAERILPPALEQRYPSNLAFFETFANLGTSRYQLQDRLRRAHVLLLGVGGLGSSVLPGLAGSGVGRITLLDCDRVELKNLTRQFLYTEADIGQPKLDRAAVRARALNSAIRIETVSRRVSGPADVADLLTDVDLVICGIDRPAGVSFWINDACVGASVPMIVGGMTVTRLVYWSVWPGESGCMRCWQPNMDPGSGGNGIVTSPDQTNRALGPIATLAGGLVGVEALRYLTRFAAPVSAGSAWLFDLVSGTCAVEDQWERQPDCRVCGTADKVAAQSPAASASGSGRA
jgi:molybdopterin/thiamine biosynthesis adenylyltransferase